MGLGGLECLPYSARSVAASALPAPSETPRIDCDALTELRDIDEADVGCRPSRALWMRDRTPGITTCQKAFLVFFYVTSVFGITASLNFTALVDE